MRVSSSRWVAVTVPTAWIILILISLQLILSVVHGFAIRPGSVTTSITWIRRPTTITHDATSTDHLIVVRTTTTLLPSHHRHYHYHHDDVSSSKLLASLKREGDTADDDDDDTDDPLFDGRTTVSLVSGQALLIVIAIVTSWMLNATFVIDFSQHTVILGSLWALPLFGLAFVLEGIEDRYPALQDVTLATQRSVLALLGGTYKPLLAIFVSVVLGIVAGVGEEMLFRGIVQDELSRRLPNSGFGIGITSILFGMLHAVTPLYAILAAMASVYFGLIYQWSSLLDGGGAANLAIPIVTHGLYDIGALLWAHWTVTTQMSPDEQEEIANWDGPSSS